MDKERHILNEEDEAILDIVKSVLTDSINELLKRNVRRTNIQIELEQCIKEALKQE